MSKRLISKKQFTIETSLFVAFWVLTVSIIIISIIKGNYLALGGWCCAFICSIIGFIDVRVSYKASNLINDLNKIFEPNLIDPNASDPSPDDVKNLHKKYFDEDIEEKK